jgi:hypothetical protein
MLCSVVSCRVGCHLLHHPTQSNPNLSLPIILQKKCVANVYISTPSSHAPLDLNHPLYHNPFISEREYTVAQYMSAHHNHQGVVSNPTPLNSTPLQPRTNPIQ